MIGTVRQRLDEATRALTPISESPRSDAEFLFAHVLGVSRARLIAQGDRTFEAPRFDALIERRLSHEPVAYILGEWEFYSMWLEVAPPMLVPRPETEHLVEVALEHIGQNAARVLEIGTGTGCVSMAIAKNAPNATIIATDSNPAALALAARNIRTHKLEKRVEFRLGDLFDVKPTLEGPFDVICSNPPYVEDAAWSTLSETIRSFEDPKALMAGVDGLDLIRRLIVGADAYLAPGGLLAFEIGDTQSARVLALLKKSGFIDGQMRNDLAGIPRIAFARKP